MRFLKLKLFIVCICVYPFLLSGQDFINGINSYNRAKYDSLIYVFVPNFLQQHKTEHGIAKYFLAESYYNKGLTQTDKQLAVDAFESARQSFLFAADDEQLQTEYPEYSAYAGYKVGWCSFRQAELGVSPVAMFRQAHDDFSAISLYIADSIRVQAIFMQAESIFREAELVFFKSMNHTLSESVVSKFKASVLQASQLYDNVLSFENSGKPYGNLPELQQITKMKKEFLKLFLARLYIASSFELGANHAKMKQRAGYRKNANDMLSSISFADENESGSSLQGLRDYYSMTFELYNYYIQRSSTPFSKVMDYCDNIDLPELGDELKFRKANLYHAGALTKNGELNDFVFAFYDSSKAIDESVYWLGHLQMIEGNQKAAEANLQQFLLQNKSRLSQGPRLKWLLEDARYRTMLLRFERAYLKNNIAELRSLSQKIDSYVPEHVIIAGRMKELALLVNAGLRGNSARIWSEVLVGSESDKLEQALATIRLILPRAALNIGAVRERYLQLLNNLLALTREKKADETMFYEGIVKSLQAEIEVTSDEKVVVFRQAANLLGGISPSFPDKHEADYIRARALFFADNFKASKDILTPLINKHKYLRASFYLAEIFRQENNGMAAKNCYENIINKLLSAASSYDEFWLSNAIAGLQLSGDDGSLAVLDSVNIRNVSYQPGLTPALLAYERLAEEKLLKEILSRESFVWMLLYGLPLRNIYPSVRGLENDLVASGNFFNSVVGAIDEVRAPIKSGLRLKVVKPKGVSADVSVFVDGESLQLVDGFYLRKSIALNTEMEIRIINPGCYEFKKRHLFNRPGQDLQTVFLNRKLSFEPTGNSLAILKDNQYPLKTRRDQNFVLKTHRPFAEKSDLYSDYQSKIELRDFDYDTVNGRILGINSFENSITIYSLEGMRTGLLDLPTGVSLKSPEGLAIDSASRIYVSDWGNHRVVVLDSLGAFQYEVGAYGKNDTTNIGQPVKFVFPTRLAVVEEAVGEVDNKGFVQNYLYVADYNGIHICKPDGSFLGTLINENKYFKKGEFYGFLTKVKGHLTQLFVLDRLSGGMAHEFNAE